MKMSINALIYAILISKRIYFIRIYKKIYFFDESPFQLKTPPPYLPCLKASTCISQGLVLKFCDMKKCYLLTFYLIIKQINCITCFNRLYIIYSNVFFNVHQSSTYTNSPQVTMIRRFCTTLFPHDKRDLYCTLSS